MIPEHVVLPIRAGRGTEFEAAFETAFAIARSLIEAATGFRGPSLRRGVVHPDTHLLLVEWGSVEARGIECRASAHYGRRSDLLHGSPDPLPTETPFGPIHFGRPSGHRGSTMKRVEREYARTSLAMAM